MLGQSRYALSTLLAFGMTGAFLPTAPAHAEPLSFSADFAVELENDYTFDADDPAAELNDFFATIEGALALEVAPGSGVYATLVLEPIDDPVDDRFLEDHGLYAEELYVAHDFGAAAVKLGKFNPAFGVAWDAAPGIYGVDFAEDYELTERVGLGLDIPLGGAGEHQLSLAAFFADTSFLSDSVIESRGQLDRSDGGASNTESPESASAELSGSLGEAAYNLGLRHQKRGRGDAGDETGVVLGLSRPLALGGAEVTVLGELAWFENFDGGPDEAVYGTLGLEADIAGPAVLSAVYAVRDAENADTDHLATVTADFELAEGLTLGAGYRYGREGGGDSHTLGALLVYEFGI
ncbi:hypothetical protein DDZ14_19180 [Maritimibacter sp. 55A14]|nr:hypothetical protein DDZ14_19180 [Maritimibacter sp. 55A14]